VQRIIATDEAGYGPSLGPLVIAATVWEAGQANELASLFDLWSSGVPLGGAEFLPMGDSKKVFKRNQAGALDPLESSVAAFCGHLAVAPIEDLGQLIHFLAPNDALALRELPWFAQLDSPFPVSEFLRERVASYVQRLEAEFQERECNCIHVAARVLDANSLNRLFETLGNKATVLSETTIALVRDLLQKCTEARGVAPTIVLCDRHGGRQRYASLIQKFFPDVLPEIIEETSLESRYRMTFAGQLVEWRFTVKGDQQFPVGLASIHAKYLRERLMEAFNRFWLTEQSLAIAPTAGYPTDAKRFFLEIQSRLQQLKIPVDAVWRSR
jgi:ribonuclease HII